MILFGVRSPLVVEIEETMRRLHLPLEIAVSITGTPRLLQHERLIAVDDFQPMRGQLFMSAAFAPMRRKALVDQAKALGLALADALIDPTSVLASTVRVGKGSFINTLVSIGAVSRIGESVVINRSASVGHHCLIGDYVSIGPGATLAGNIAVGEGSVIGAGAVVLPNLRIGVGSIVAAGAVVRGHVPDGVLVEGHPARRHAFKPERSSLYVEDGE